MLPPPASPAGKNVGLTSLARSVLGWESLLSPLQQVSPKMPVRKKRSSRRKKPSRTSRWKLSRVEFKRTLPVPLAEEELPEPAPPSELAGELGPEPDDLFGGRKFPDLCIASLTQDLGQESVESAGLVR